MAPNETKPREDGGPAFPCHPEWLGHGLEGMRLRDYFAGQALIGVLANPNWNSLALNLTGIADSKAALAAGLMAYAYADALIAARAAGRSQEGGAP
jgi:hypothetical protein